MSEIISDGVRTITSDSCNNNGYGNCGRGYDNRGFLDAYLFTQNSWKEDNHGSERTAEVIEAISGSERTTSAKLDDTHVAIIESARNTDGLVTNGFMQTRTDAINFANQARTDTLQSKYEVLLDSGKNAAAAALAACSNTAALQASIASCCCEIKELIREDGGKTRDLITSSDAVKSAAEIAELKMELALSNQGRPS